MKDAGMIVAGIAAAEREALPAQAVRTRPPAAAERRCGPGPAKDPAGIAASHTSGIALRAPRSGRCRQRRLCHALTVNPRSYRTGHSSITCYKTNKCIVSQARAQRLGESYTLSIRLQKQQLS